MKKAIKWTLIVAAILIIAGIVIVFLSLNSIVRRTVETQATASTTLTTTLDSASVSILGGKVGLSGLSIASPRGFAADQPMFKLGAIEVKVNYSQLNDTPIHIALIDVQSPTLLVEQQGGKLNLRAAMEQMPPSESSTMRLVIDELNVRQTQVILRPNLPMLEQQYTLTLPDITLKNVGTGEGAENGAAIKDVLNKVIAALADELESSGQLPPGVKGLISGEDLKKQLEGKVQEQLQATTQKAQEQTEQLKQRGRDELQKGLQDLLGGQKK